MPREALDRITKLAASIFEAPIALVTVLDDERQWFLSNRGYPGDSTTREESFCAHMVGQPAGSALIVPDASRDPRFVDNRLVTEEGVRFYAGAIITAPDGAQIGALCVIDTAPRPAPTEAQIDCLRQLAALAANEIEAAKRRRAQTEELETLELAESMAGVGNFSIDRATGRTRWSDEVFRIHGLAPGDVDPGIYSRQEGHYHPEDLERVRTVFREALDRGTGFDAQLRLFRPAGEERVARARARAQFGAKGEVVSMFGVFQDITEQVRDRERIGRSEALFRLLSETSNDIIARYGPDGTFRYVSPAVQSILGVAPETMIGRRCREWIHPDDLAETYARLSAYVAEGPGAATPHIEYRALRADGSVVWLEASPRAIFDAEGRLIEMQDHVRDITARKAVQREQAELLQTLTLAETVAKIGHWRLDLTTQTVSWSPEVYRIHGVTPDVFDPSLEDAVGFYHPDDRQKVRDWVARAIATGEPDEFLLRILRPDGEERVVAAQCQPELDEAGQVRALFGVLQDVTDRIESHAAVAASEARYRRLADRVADVIATYDLQGTFTYLSPSIERMMGYAPEEMVGRRFQEFLHPDDVRRVRAAFNDYARAGPDAPSPRIPYRAIRKDGEMVWLEAHPTLFMADGEPVGFQDLVRDVTDRKRLEAELVEARDRAEAGGRAKSEFLANMSHELRTPLTAVIGFSGLLKTSPNLPDQERRFADRIATASESLLAVINDILDYSKLEAEAVDLDPRAFNPVGLAEQALSIVEQQCRDKGLDLRLETEGSATEDLVGDDGRLRQVLLNFLSNAVKFTAAGAVSLRLSAVAEGSLRRLRAEVSDTGMGIPAETLQTLFERFTQADASTTRTHGGTGLGLAISRRLIEIMGGEVGASSRLGEGSVFWFEVPLPVAAAAAEAFDDADPAMAPSGGRVLVVDDAPANRELVTAILNGFGLEVETARDGAEGVEAARTGGFDLILMDVHMPVLDGLAATRAIRALPGPAAGTPILALTANVQADQVDRCLAAGMDGHLGKPIQLTDLAAALTRWLGQKAAA